MRMRDYSVNDYGLVVNETAIKLIAEKMYDDFTEESWTLDKYEFIEGVAESLGLEMIVAFTGEAISVNEDGYDDYSNIDYYEDDFIYYVCASKYSTLFCSAYKCMSDLLDELMRPVKDYLPDWFQYRDFVRHIVGVYYG